MSNRRRQAAPEAPGKAMEFTDTIVPVANPAHLREAERWYTTKSDETGITLTRIPIIGSKDSFLILENSPMAVLERRFLARIRPTTENAIHFDSLHAAQQFISNWYARRRSTDEQKERIHRSSVLFSCDVPRHRLYRNVKTNGKDVTVMGSLTRDMSLKFADSIQQWMPEALKREPEPAVETVN